LGGGFKGAGGTTVIIDNDAVTSAAGISLTAKSSGRSPDPDPPTIPPGGLQTVYGHGADIGAGYENSNHGNQLILTNNASGDYLIGNVVLPDTISVWTIGARDKLVIPNGASLRIPYGVKFVNEGVIENYGTLDNDFELENNGKIENKGTMRNAGRITGNPVIGNSAVSYNPSSYPTVSPDDRDWYTPGGNYYRELRAANDRLWVQYSLSGGTATLYLTPYKAEEIAENSEDGTADIDLSSLDGVTETTFPRAALDYFADKGLDVEFIMPRGVVHINRTAARDIAGQGNNTQMYLRFRPVQAQTLNATLQKALRSGDAAYELSVTVGSQNIRSFNGSVRVSVPYDDALPGAAWHLNDRGEKEKAESYYENGSLHFTIRYLSLLAVGRGATPAGGGDLPWYYTE
jgi:hypothetical protein